MAQLWTLRQLADKYMIYELVNIVDLVIASKMKSYMSIMNILEDGPKTEYDKLIEDFVEKILITHFYQDDGGDSMYFNSHNGKIKTPIIIKKFSDILKYKSKEFKNNIKNILPGFKIYKQAIKSSLSLNDIDEQDYDKELYEQEHRQRLFFDMIYEISPFSGGEDYDVEYGAFKEKELLEDFMYILENTELLIDKTIIPIYKKSASYWFPILYKKDEEVFVPEEERWIYRLRNEDLPEIKLIGKSFEKPINNILITHFPEIKSITDDSIIYISNLINRLIDFFIEKELTNSDELYSTIIPESAGISTLVIRVS